MLEFCIIVIEKKDRKLIFRRNSIITLNERFDVPKVIGKGADEIDSIKYTYF